MSKLLLTFYGDDFTGSTDALEQLTLAGIRTALFIEPPTPKQLTRFKNLQAVGVAGMTRSLAPNAMERELRPALKKLKSLGAPHVHYKVCSTFDSSPTVGSIGRVIDVATTIFRAPFVPLLVAAPALGRYCIFGNLFARMGIGSDGAIHRLDRHPSISKHPITPMEEADLRLHLAKQTKKRIGLFDILKVALPSRKARVELERLLNEPAPNPSKEGSGPSIARGQFPSWEGSGVGPPEVILFDALHTEHVEQIGELIDVYASRKHPLFSVGSSGIEMALGAYWLERGCPSRSIADDNGRVEFETRNCFRSAAAGTAALRKKQVLVASGSCSPVTSSQIAWALNNGFAEVPLNATALASAKQSANEIRRGSDTAASLLRAGRSVILHTTRSGPDRRIATKSGSNTAEVLGSALGEVLRCALERSKVRRVCIAGGDTSSFAARALGIEALEMIAPLTPGAPLCRAHAPGSPMDGCEVVFKGGQVGAENYFETVRRGKT